ncbi:MAG: triose-phosphate isomerase [Candidatus Omnitrophica bacterium]|nr:triose-phosphate isomerase [Candidatus Omnitrophota bacterium]MBU1871230.1 triose-phosphate isomerase [Candidatus Omnitrophota bacterium]
MRRLIIAGNWKMYKNISESLELTNGLKRELYDIENIDIVLCPVFTSLASVSEVLTDSNIQLGAQDVYWQKEGAFTGEISASMLKDAGCLFVIIGHSERRQYFSESNQSVNQKLKAVLESGMAPIVCVGETLKQREANKTLDIIKEQLQEGLEGISAEDAGRLIIAYEPVWAIGTGKNATATQAEEVHAYIRSLLEKIYTKDIAASIRIQYGGSVKPGNIEELMQQPDIDGALVGGASLNVDSFSEIIKISQRVRK